MRIFIFGLGEIGKYLLNMFANAHQIVVSDLDVDTMETVAENYGVEYLDYEILDDLETSFDYAFLVSDDVSTNVMLSIQMISQGCKNVVCYVNDERSKKVLEKLNIMAFSQAEIAKNIILRSFRGGIYRAIFENMLDTYEGKSFRGKSLSQIKNGLFVISNNRIIKDNNYVVQDDDIVVVYR
ncbi:MAG: NAD-binding protein [Candidatus Anstonellales archaeon]